MNGARHRRGALAAAVVLAGLALACGPARADGPRTVVINVPEDGRCTIDGEVHKGQRLRDRLQIEAEVAGREMRDGEGVSRLRVVLRVHDYTPYGVVRQLFDLCDELGIPDVTHRGMQEDPRAAEVVESVLDGGSRAVFLEPARRLVDARLAEMPAEDRDRVSKEYRPGARDRIVEEVVFEAYHETLALETAEAEAMQAGRFDDAGNRRRLRVRVGTLEPYADQLAALPRIVFRKAQAGEIADGAELELSWRLLEWHARRAREHEGRE